METESLPNQAQVIYFSHGGGPLPILGDESHRAMVEFMRELPSQIRRPEAILVISAHWEEREATLLGAPSPGLLYDYYGFPEEAYRITYPVPGNSELARQIVETLEQQQIPARIDYQRGLDHGVFIPLKLMYPQADIPSLQLSLLRSLDPAEHMALGKALGELMQRNLLVIGSGFSFHNMSAFSWQGGNTPDPANDAFQDWLIEVCTGSMQQVEREQSLVAWEKAPYARYCHPREEHLLPLHVCQGLAQKPARLIFDDNILGKRGIALLW